MKLHSRWSYLLPFVTALLFYASFHPLNLYPLAWVAFVPLIVFSLQERAGWKVFLTTYAAGYLCFMMGFQWTGHVIPIAPYLLALYKGIFFPLFAFALRYAARDGISPIFAAPVVWTSFEFLRSYLVTGFPWFFLGHTQHRMNALIQICDVTGVYGITFLLLYCNGLLAHAISMPTDERRFKSSRITFIALLLCVFGYGVWRNNTLEIREGPSALVVQANIPQEVKKTRMSIREIFERQCAVTEEGLQKGGAPDLVIWAETMYPYPLVYDSKERKFSGDWLLLGLPQKWNVPLFAGATVCEPPEELQRSPSPVSDADFWLRSKKSNSALLLTKEKGIIGRYDKIHLVPFGEYIPLRETFSFLDDFLKNYSELAELPDLKAGKEYTRFELRGWSFGASICYESIFPEIVRGLRNNGAQFVINISNDGWFKESPELDQMLAITTFRAVENRIGIIRATNTGISAFISPVGRITSILTDNAGNRKSVQGVLRGRVEISDTVTFYSVNGDFFCYVVLALFCAMLLFPIFRKAQGLFRRRRPDIGG